MTADAQNSGPLSDQELNSLMDDVAENASDAVPSDALMARIMQDATDNMPATGGTHPAAQVPPGGANWFSGFIAQIGGLPGAAGLAAAGIGGLMIGIADPATFDAAAAYLGLEVVAYDVDDLFATFPVLAEEG